MYPDIASIKKILIDESYISEADSKAAEADAQSTSDYLAFLIDKQLLSKPLLGQAIAEAYKVPFVDLEAQPPSKENVILLPENLARTNRIVVVRQDENQVILASDNPTQIDGKALAKIFPQKKLFITYALPEHIENSFRLFEQPLDTRFSEIIAQGKRVAPEIVDEIIKDALMYHASDIHFEPQTDIVLVRFRVDGNLRLAGKLPKEYYENILNRIKVESAMRIDEHSIAQDGAIRHEVGDQAVDLRISLVPTVEGEKVVMRVLGLYVQGFTLSDLGLEERQRLLIETYATKPFGMLLTVGPTGSGKTTSLYSLLKLLAEPQVNVTTIEDPVEYKIPGINQIQVRETSGLTFAKGLRSIVRQDPDIILVGEIRDQETAEIAINAALTGHLLLSTFHANDASTAIPRLIDMGIEPFLLASTLELIIAQRLVRKICRHCRYSLPIKEALKVVATKNINLSGYFTTNDNVYAGKGCNTCAGTGFEGRTALFEFLEITPEMQDLITSSPSGRNIEALSRKQGDTAMFDDGIAKVKKGITTIAELIRVVEPPRSMKAKMRHVK